MATRGRLGGLFVAEFANGNVLSHIVYKSKHGINTIGNITDAEKALDEKGYCVRRDKWDDERIEIKGETVFLYGFSKYQELGGIIEQSEV